MFLEEPPAYRALVFSCRGPRGCSEQASPCDAWRLVYISVCPRASVPQEDSVDQPQVDFIQRLHAPKTWRTAKGGPGSPAEREDILFNNDTTLTKLRYAHYGYFLYLLFGKSHFKDLCYLEAKLFFFFFFFFVNRMQFFTIPS